VQPAGLRFIHSKSVLKPLACDALNIRRFRWQEPLQQTQDKPYDALKRGNSSKYRLLW
jgi:hypothetical protein